MSKYKFKAPLQKIGSWVVAVTPLDVKKTFGTTGIVRTSGTIDGQPYVGISLMQMGTGAHCMAIRSTIRKALKKDVGDMVEIVLERHTDNHIELPKELKEAFRESKIAKKLFDSYTYSHRNEYVKYVSDAKRQETRDKRAVDIVIRLERIAAEKKIK
jgi:hypothetical protein